MRALTARRSPQEKLSVSVCTLYLDTGVVASNDNYFVIWAIAIWRV